MKTGRKRIILIAAAVAFVCAFIAANVVLAIYSPLIHQVFAGNNTDYDSEEAENALVAGDQLVQDIAADSIVLLRNENAALPLAEDVKVNLFGWNATDNGFMLTGGGSGGTLIAATNKVTLTQAFQKEKVAYNEELLAAYAAVSSKDADANSGAQSTDLYNPGASFYTDALMSQAKAYSDVAVVVFSRFARENGGEGELLNPTGYKNGSILTLTANEKLMMEQVTANFDKVVVLLNTCNNMELSFLEDYAVDAALYVGLPGQSGALAIPRVLTGKVTPSGRTADTYAYRYRASDDGSEVFDPTLANAIYNGSSIVYQEGIYFGYKWYETADAEGFFDSVDNKYGAGYDGVVQYPFGYGQSYADFTWQIESLPASDAVTADGKYELKVRVTNTSDADVSGKEVVQLYYTPEYQEGGIEKAEMNLLAFGKTEELARNKSQVITLSFTAYDLASYDAYDKNGNGFRGWELDAGKYEIKLMKNAHHPAEVKDKNDINKAAAASFTLTAGETVKLANDPVTGEKVENRFTGEGAYAGVPIDGSNVLASAVSYTSRAGGFANFPRTAAPTVKETAKVNAAASYAYDGYDGQSKPEQGAAPSLFLVTNKDGSQASLAALKGDDKTAELVPNKELLAKLGDYDAPEWEILLGQLTEGEINNLIREGGFQTAAVVSVGKPRSVDRDGPAGFNMGVTNANTDSRWTAFPVEALIGCSWNPKSAYNMGRSQGAVAAATDLRGWYAPGVNLHRSPYNSRNFEYYSEDGVLSGMLAAEVIRGAKQNNLYCYIKHFAVSEAGQNPNNKNTWLTEQTLREIYLKPFEIAVKKGGANGIMSAFNRVGAVWAGSNHALSTDILRNEWGFRGTMITDWYDKNYMELERGIRGGNDLWLAGGEGVASSINMKNAASAYCARVSAKNILYTYAETYAAALDYQENGDPDDPYKVLIDTIKVTAAPFSPLFVVLWVLIDAALAAGAGVCVYFAFFRGRRRKTAA